MNALAPSPQAHLRAWLDAHPVVDPDLGPCPLGVGKADPRPNNGCIAAGFLSYLLPIVEADGPWMRVGAAHRYGAHTGVVEHFAHHGAAHPNQAVRYLAIQGARGNGHVWWFEDNSGLLARLLPDGSALVHPAILRMTAPPAGCSVRFSPFETPPALHLRVAQPGTPRKRNLTLDADLVGPAAPHASPWNMLLRAGVDALNGVFDAPTAPLLPPHLAPKDAPTLWARSGPRLETPGVEHQVQRALQAAVDWLAHVVSGYCKEAIDELTLTRLEGYKTNAATLAWVGARLARQNLSGPQWRAILPEELGADLAAALRADLGLHYAMDARHRWAGQERVLCAAYSTRRTAHGQLAAVARHGPIDAERLALMRKLIPELGL